MTDGALLLAAILAGPDEDTPRLVYADWLEDNGQPERAEFIRVQIALSQRPEIETHLIEYRRTWTCIGLVSRDIQLPTSIISIRHRQRDDSWYEETGFKIGCVDEFDSSRVKVTFVKVDDTLTAREWDLKRPEDVTWHFYWRIGKAGTTLHYPPQSFSRGFLSSVEMTWGEWKAHCKSLIRQHPVWKVTLTTQPPGEATFYRDETTQNWKCDMWPVIEFELPPEPRWRNYVTQYSNVTSEELMRRLQAAADPNPSYEPPLSIE